VRTVEQNVAARVLHLLQKLLDRALGRRLRVRAAFWPDKRRMCAGVGSSTTRSGIAWPMVGPRPVRKRWRAFREAFDRVPDNTIDKTA
jgi:hypothetical protein